MSSFTSGGKSIRIHQHETPAPGGHPAIVLLHGSGGNISFWLDRIAPFIARLNINLYAIHYFDRTGTVRATEADIRDGFHYPEWLATISDGLTHIRTRPNVDPDRIALLGISLGAFLALTLGTDPAARVRAIVEISGGLPEPYDAGATAAYPATLVLHGAADQIVSVEFAHRLGARLSQLGVVHETRIYPNQGHWFDGPTQMQILMAIAGFLAKYL